MEQSDTLELYKICIEEAGKISERRMKNNIFFITILASIATIIVGFIQASENILLLHKIVVSMLCVLAIFMCCIWNELTLSYKRLNGAKFDVILELEKKLSYPCFAKEWDFCKAKEHKEFSLSELQIPSIFLFFYVILIIVILIQ